MRHRYLAPVSLLMALLMCCVCVVPTMASDVSEITTEVVYYEDGSYSVVSLEVLNAAFAGRSANTRVATKTDRYYNSDNELLWDFTLHGTFTYDGTTATAISASYSYNIYDSAWTLKSADAYCSGNQAIAEGKFNGGFLLNRSTSITLTCSPTGTLS